VKLGKRERPGYGLSCKSFISDMSADLTPNNNRNHKPTESDLEDDDDEDDDDDDPATWFEDDQDDGIKGQDIVQPDAEDLVNIIRIDESKFHYSTFYEPRHEGD
jgi:hypothetical protein